MSLADVQIHFTDNAANKVAALITEEQNPNYKLRIYIRGGGCSGFEYGFSFDETKKVNDFSVIKKASDGQNVELLIDATSYQYLIGAEIDYTSGIEGEQFVIRNPNAKTTCGCGSSFSLEDD